MVLQHSALENSQLYSPEQFHAWAPEIYADSFRPARFARYSVFVAEMSGTIAGFAEFENTGHIDCFYVHCEMQGQGVGTRLQRLIEQDATNNQLTKLFADVSITAKPFFESRGFNVVREQIKAFRGSRFKQYVMNRHLSHK